MFFHPIARRAVPARVLTRRFDGLLDDTLDQFFSPVALDKAATRAPSLDISESDTAYTLTLDVPGLSREQLKVSIDDKRVTVEAEESQQAEKKDGERVLYRERSTRRYARSIALPAEVDEAASQAKLENGVLTLTLAKKVPAGAKRIAVN